MEGWGILRFGDAESVSALNENVQCDICFIWRTAHSPNLDKPEMHDSKILPLCAKFRYEVPKGFSAFQ